LEGMVFKQFSPKHLIPETVISRETRCLKGSVFDKMRIPLFSERIAKTGRMNKASTFMNDNAYQDRTIPSIRVAVWLGCFLGL
jgi:hypothetical protein